MDVKTWYLAAVFCLAQCTGCTGLENKIFTSCEELRIEGGYKYSCEILDDLKTEEWNSSLVLLAHTEKGADPQYHPDEVIKVSRASIILRECINVSYRSFNIFSKERWIHFIVAGNEERSDNVITASPALGVTAEMLSTMPMLKTDTPLLKWTASSTAFWGVHIT
ncbi:hypothetical protein COCON_G00206980 [Conger conger]|uniref:Uncharacterized protein n=1 Tax=Conger conger TaxID=82655 RepID=A0A9Q1D001_CONCO|nr:hypothetical protein COCON_G00206980 [Conger conger]